jgi:hypothetical protein
MVKPIYIINPNVYWINLSSNHKAIHILEQNLDEVNWYNLSLNPEAIHILEQNLDKVDWLTLLCNPKQYIF